MKKIRIVADDKIPFLPGSPLKDAAEMIFLPGAAITGKELMNADAVITRTRTKCNAETLDGTRIRAIATATIGCDHIDAEYCAKHGIAWKNAPGCNAPSVAQYITSLLLRLSLKHGFSLRGKKLGVIGAGNVGKRVIEKAKILGMEVLVNDPPRAEAEGSAGFCSLETIAREADIVTLHVPLEKTGPHATYHLADEYFIKSMKPDAFLINSSRGSVADNSALKKALKEHRIAGAALDVWEKEPEIDPELLDLLDYATPHIAGYSTDGKANGTAASVRFIADFFGLPGMADWFPSVPQPPNAEIAPNSLAEAVFASYDIATDDQRLRNSPETFEKQRGSYPLRREFPAYRIINSDTLDPELQNTLAALGFRLK